MSRTFKIIFRDLLGFLLLIYILFGGGPARADTTLTEPIIIDPNMILKPGINVGPLKGWMIVKINNTCVPNVPNACWGFVPIYAPPEQYPWWNYSLNSPLVP